MNNNSKLVWVEKESSEVSFLAEGHNLSYEVWEIGHDDDEAGEPLFCVAVTYKDERKSQVIWDQAYSQSEAQKRCQMDHDSITSLLAERDEIIFKEICNMLQVKSADYADRHDVTDNDVTACHMSGGSMACDELVAEVKAIQEALSLHKKGVS